MKREAQAFTVNEWLEALLRCRDTQPRRYAREVSAGTRRRVELYAGRKAAAAERRKAA